MRKFLLAMALGFISFNAAEAAVVANVQLAEVGGTLLCQARLTGIESGQTVKVTFHWTAPAVFYVRQNGEKIKLFGDSSFTPEKALGDASSKALCFCSDTKEKGCARTRSYRTLVTTLGNGEKRRAEGLWKVSLVDEAGAVLGSAEYLVK